MESFIGQDASKEVILYFVVPKSLTQETCSVQLQSSYQACVDMSFVCNWSSEQQIVAMTPRRRDVFICDPFEGDAFDHLTSGNFKCVVLGPQCLLTCLSRCISVPDLGYPLYTAAMRGLVVTSTGFDRAEKTRIQRLVRLMAGVYCNDLHEGVTHLVTAVVASAKYQVAIERKIPVLRVCWVDRVWECSCASLSASEHVHATDAQFEELRCGPLQGLSVCVSQMTRKDKDMLKKIIVNNGGIYMPQLECDKTRVLITPTVEGDKVSFARKWQIPCVVVEWLYDSVESNVCLPTESYSVFCKTNLASTPSKTTPNNGVLDNLSVSCIRVPDESGRHVDESIITGHPSHTAPITASTDSAALQELESVNLNDALSRVQFLDGCKIHMYGTFDDKVEEKLRRLLNVSGAVRLGDITSASHVLLAPGASWPAAAAVEDCHHQLVTVQWLLACRRAGRVLPVSEAMPGTSISGADQTTLLELPPPSSSSTSSSATTTTTTATAVLANTQQRVDISLTDHSELEDTQSLFAGCFFRLSPRLERKHATECRSLLTENGATIVKSAPSPSRSYFIIVPLISSSDDNNDDDHLEEGEKVTLTYLQHCVEVDQMVSVQYYHRPIRVRATAARALLGCVLAVSGYSGRERHFLALLAESMSAVFQEVFARRDNSSRNIRASTLLVCPPTAGDSNKCRAARRWNLPVVHCGWLLACAEAGSRVDTAQFEVLAASAASSGDVLSSSTAPSILGNNPAAVGTAGTPDFMRLPPPVTPVRPLPLPATPTPSVNKHLRQLAAPAGVVINPVDSPTADASSPGGSTRRAWKRLAESTCEDSAKRVKHSRRISTPMSQLVLKFFKNLPAHSENDPALSSGISAQQVKDDILAEMQAVSTNISTTMSSTNVSTFSTTNLSNSSTCVDEKHVHLSATSAATEQLNNTSCSDKKTADDSCVSRQLEELQLLVQRRRSDVIAAAACSSTLSIAAAPLSPSALITEPCLADSQNLPSAHDVDTQNADVTWSDTRDTLARNQLLSASTTTSIIAANGDACSASSSLSSAPVFAFSGVDAKERQRLGECVQRLGGRFSDAPSLESCVTHLITVRPNRSEKHLACIAAGLWMLRPDYMTACDKERRFVNPELYEWSCSFVDNNDAAVNKMAADCVERRVATAATLWRRKIQQKGLAGAFTNMVASVLTSGDERRRAFERLVAAGGGTCCPPAELDSCSTLTHVFIEPNRVKPQSLLEDEAWWQKLASRKVPCLLPIFLNEFLMSDNAPPFQQFYVEQYRKYVS